MIRFFSFFGACILFFVLLVDIPAWGASKPKIVIGGDHDNLPYEFLENGTPGGSDIDLIRAVADVMGFDAEFRLGPWNKVRRDLEQGNVDVLAGMYFSKERSRLVDFSAPHTMVTPGLFVRKGSSIRSFDDLRGKDIIVQESDIVHDLLLRTRLSMHIIAVKDAGQTIKLLASGKHDCVLMPSKLQGEYYLKKFGITNIQATTTNLPQLHYCFAVRKGNRELLYKLDEGLNILRINGTYQKIYEKWFGVYERRSIWEATKYYVLALTFVAALLMACFLWSWSLRNQAREQLKQRQEQLEELNKTLDNRVREEVAQNRQKDLMLIRQNRQAALGEMLDHIAHQWKQPLNTIYLIIQNLGESWSCNELAEGSIEDTVDKTKALVEHMSQTINVFRDFYRPEKEKKFFSIKESIDKALSFIAPALRINSIEVELEVDPELSAFGYPKEYAQVLLNILVNARDVFKAREIERPKMTISAFKKNK